MQGEYNPYLGVEIGCFSFSSLVEALTKYLAVGSGIDPGLKQTDCSSFS